MRLLPDEYNSFQHRTDETEELFHHSISDQLMLSQLETRLSERQGLWKLACGLAGGVALVGIGWSGL